MRQEFQDWFVSTGIMVVCGALIGFLASALWSDFHNATKCPAGTAYIQQHCVVVVEPVS